MGVRTWTDIESKQRKGKVAFRVVRVDAWLTLLSLINMQSTVSGGVCVWEGRNDLAHHDVTAVIYPFSYACYIVLSQGL